MQLYLSSTIGAITGFVYFFIVNCCMKIADEKIEKCFSSKLEKIEVTDNFKNWALGEKQIANKEIERRNNQALVIGTLLLSTSFFILINTFGNDFNNAYIELASWASIGLHISWVLILHMSTRYLDNISYAFITAIESRLGIYEVNKENVTIGYHSFMRKYINTLIMWLRTGFWGITLMALSLLWHYRFNVI